MVFRDRLVDRLLETDAGVVAVVAPAGYGKTTTLAQWARSSDRTIAWLTLRAGDSDARNFLLRVSAAVTRAAPSRPASASLPLPVRALEVDALEDGGLLREISRVSGPFSLVLDNVHILRTQESKDVLRRMAELLEGRGQLVVASRSDPDLPVAHMRAGRGLLELTEVDLAMTVEEVDGFLEAEGESGSLAEQVSSATGGWPAAISLIIPSKLTSQTTNTWSSETLDHRFLADYVRSEIISTLPKSHQDLLVKLAPLERVNGSLAEAVAANASASTTLEKLATSSHLVRPLDDGVWYEMNRILRRVLRADLDMNDPVAAAEIHARAAVWFETHDMPLEAIGHAQKAGDSELFAILMERLIKVRYAAGHVADVLLWMSWLQMNTSLDRHPNLAAMGALVHIQEGNVLETETWLKAAARAPTDQDTDAVVWLVRAAATRSGVERMLEEIDKAETSAGPGSRWLPAILAIRGLAHVMMGEADRAESCFTEAVGTGLENESLISVVMALGQRAMIAIARKDWELATDLATKCMAIIDEHNLGGYQASGLGLIAAARCARRAGEIEKTISLLARASLVRPRLSAALPGESVQILIELAKAYIELSDVVGARVLIREADDIVIQRPELGVLPSQLEALRSSLAGLGPGTIGLSALTKAELRLLPFLATNLSFPEIGEQLYISRHTVKTQAMSIYRKLGTSSRSDAVAKAYETGLLQR